MVNSIPIKIQIVRPLTESAFYRGDDFVMFCSPPSTKLLQLFRFLLCSHSRYGFREHTLFVLFSHIGNVIASKCFTLLQRVRSQADKSPLYCYEEGQHDFHIRIASNSNSECSPADRRSHKVRRSKEMQRTKRFGGARALQATKLGMHSIWKPLKTETKRGREHKTADNKTIDWISWCFLFGIIYWITKSADIRTMPLICINILKMRQYCTRCRKTAPWSILILSAFFCMQRIYDIVGVLAQNEKQ